MVLVLAGAALFNLLTKELATISGLAFTAVRPEQIIAWMERLTDVTGEELLSLQGRLSAEHRDEVRDFLRTNWGEGGRVGGTAGSEDDDVWAFGTSGGACRHAAVLSLAPPR